MRSMQGLAVLAALVTALAGAGTAAADHVGQTLDCGDAGTYLIIGTHTAVGFEAPIGETNLFRLRAPDGTTAVYVIKEVWVDGQLRFANPGFQANDRELVECTFTGPRTGRTFTNFGILA